MFYRKYGSVIQDLTKVCLQASPEKRPSASQILSIPSLLPFVEVYVSRQNTLVRSNRSQGGRSTPAEVIRNRAVSKRAICSRQSLLEASPESPPTKTSKPSMPLLLGHGKRDETPCASPMVKRDVPVGRQNGLVKVAICVSFFLLSSFVNIFPFYHCLRVLVDKRCLWMAALVV